MDKLILSVPLFTNGTFGGVDSAQFGTWARMALYCTKRMTGGVIHNCKTWNDRAWINSVGVTRSEVHTESEIWTWDGESIVLKHYPIEQEIAYKKVRAGGKKGADKRWKSRKKIKLEMPPH